MLDRPFPATETRKLPPDKSSCYTHKIDPEPPASRPESRSLSTSPLVTRIPLHRSTLYIGAYLLSWLGPTVYHLLSWITGYQAFWSLMVLVILTPLQGFFNAFIYARPSYLRMREADPNLSRWVAVKHSFFPPTIDEANNAGSVLESEMMNRNGSWWSPGQRISKLVGSRFSSTESSNSRSKFSTYNAHSTTSRKASLASVSEEEKTEEVPVDVGVTDGELRMKSEEQGETSRDNA